MEKIYVLLKISGIQFFFSVLLLLNSTVCFAEIYQGILPSDTLANVKQKFPNAVFKQIQAVWLKEDEALISISGISLSGSISILFKDTRDFYRQLASKMKDTESIKYFENKANISFEDATFVEWVRWVRCTVNSGHSCSKLPVSAD
ncbi:hypothetical protein ACO0LC_12870 [Undibacterium sp. JH2W]|uniref:hypothetical protein n=1 Tax=Undibacterium sp. JH2W TaxID=3413037 RepID=UPI003BF0090B